jgi:penicillin-binding protein 1C
VMDMLSDPAARIPGFGTNTPFDFPFPVAVKTGTSRHFTDNWAVGVTRTFTVAVWAGNFSGRPMQGVSGVTGAGPLLARTVMATAQRRPPGTLVTPAEVGAVPVIVCRLSGMLASATCARLTEWFVPGTAPARVDDWERDGRVVLPDEYAEWARQPGTSVSEGVTLAAASEGTRERPSARDLPVRPSSAGSPSPVRASPRPATFHIAAPLDGDRYAIPAGVEGQYATISLRASGPGSSSARWTIDGRPFVRGRWPLVEGSHLFRAVSSSGASDEVRIVVVR